MTGTVAGAPHQGLDLKALAASLYVRMPGAKFSALPPALEGARGDPGKCHANAAAWCATHPGFKVVPGWIPVPYETFPNRMRFHSHSLVEDSSGQLWDVTLTVEQALAHRFIRHTGPAAVFYAAVADQELPSIEHMISPDPVWTMQGEGDQGLS